VTVQEVDPEVRNEVVLTGRLSAPPETRELPSGDVMTTFRVVVRRDAASARPRVTVDALECVVWSGRVRRTVASWRVDDVVEVQGALRRRFFRAGAGAQSRVEVEVSRARRVRRPTPG